MYRLMLIACLFAVSAVSFLSTASAQAQASRTWVSGVGDDVNPCSRTAPCKTFAGAISKTAARGEINCLDPAGFGAVTITKAITIDCEHTLGSILAAGTNGVVVNVQAADKVTLIGLRIEGFGTGLNGIRMVGAGSVDIFNSRIRGFTNNAISVAGAANAGVLVEDTTLSNSLGGIEVNGAGGVSNAAVLNRVTMIRNKDFAVKVGATSIAILNESVLAGSTASIIAVAGATVQSYGNNVIRNAGAPTATIPLK